MSSKEILKKYNQEHLLNFYDELTEDEKKILISQINSTDFNKVNNYYNESVTATNISSDRISPIPYIAKDKLSSEEISNYTKIGEDSIKNGELAIITLAGGQGTRLGYKGPKGTYEIEVPPKKSLFEFACDNLKEVQNKYNISLYWYIMTSPSNDFATRQYFEEHNYFDYPKEKIKFFVQNTFPIIDTNAKIILETPYSIKTGSNGNGDVFKSFASNGLIGDFDKNNIKWIFIGGIDNILLKLADTLFLGLAISGNYPIASKSIRKTDFTSPEWVFANVDSKPSIVNPESLSPDADLNLYNQTKNNLELESTKFDNKEDQISSLSTKINKDKLALKELETTLNKNNREITNIKYRIEYLENTLTSGTLLPKSIKSILDNPKFNGVHNVISELINVESRYGTAISTALGGASSYLVVDTPSTAKELIGYLKDNNLGRATFYPLSVINGKYIDNEVLSSLEYIPGYIGTGSSLVTFDNKYKNIIDNVLGNIIIVDNIDTANKVSTSINKRYRIVTLDGQVVNVGGSLTGGSQIKSNNTISVKYEIEELRRKSSFFEEKNKNILKDIANIDKDIMEYTSRIHSLSNEKVEYESTIASIKNDYDIRLRDKESKEKELKDLSNISNNTSEEDNLIKSLSEVRESISNINKEISILKVDEDKTNSLINEIEETSRMNNSHISKKEKELNSLNIMINRTDVKLDNLLNTLTNDYNMTYEFAINNYKLDMELETAKREVVKLKDNLSLLGNVNLDAPLEYERQKERYDFLNGQKNDLVNAENTLYDIIKEMDTIMKEKFLDTFNRVKEEFKVVYRELFKGGKAELILTDPDDLLNTGIEIKAEPPGKKLQSISLLSGGEKTFTAISLLFAILNIRPVPFCLFDEVEAALDDANVEAFGRYLDKYRNKTQFIIITHKKKTMEYADILYGITMEESGVSKIVSVKLEDVKKD